MARSQHCAVAIKMLVLWIFSGVPQVTNGMADWGYPERKDVVLLTKQNFDLFLKDYELSVVAFTSAWCDHCKESESELSKLALHYKDHEERVPVAKIDCSKDKEFCIDHLIPSYPFVNIYVRGHPIPFLGKEQNEESLNAFVQSILDNSPQKISTVAQLVSSIFSRIVTKSRKEQGISVYYLSPPLEPSNNHASYNQKSADIIESLTPFHLYDLTCKSNPWMKCYWTNDKQVSEQLGVSEATPLVWAKSKWKREHFPGVPASFEQLADFFFHIEFPGLLVPDKHFEKEVIEKGSDFLIVFTQTHADPFLKQFKDSTKQVRRRLKCVSASLDLEHIEIVSRLVKSLNVDITKLPVVLYAESIHDYTFKRYVFRSTLSPEHLNTFLEQIWGKQILPDLKSQAPPAQNEGPIKVRTCMMISDPGGKPVRPNGQEVCQTFSSVHHRSTLFRISACSRLVFIQKLTLFSKLQHDYKKDANFQFLTIDGDQNELPGFIWDVCPTLVVFFKDHRLSPEPYTGRWVFEEMVIFLDSVK